MPPPPPVQLVVWPPPLFDVGGSEPVQPQMALKTSLRVLLGGQLGPANRLLKAAEAGDEVTVQQVGGVGGRDGACRRWRARPQRSQGPPTLRQLGAPPPAPEGSCRKGWGAGQRRGEGPPSRAARRAWRHLTR